jgi:uncharacterized protein YqeY
LVTKRSQPSLATSKLVLIEWLDALAQGEWHEAKREDLANKEKAEGVIIAQYLPEQLSEAELKKMIADAIAETNAAGPAGMGLVMKVLQPKIAGKADGGLVSGLVKAALAQ